MVLRAVPTIKDSPTMRASIMGATVARPRAIHYAYPGATVAVCGRMGLLAGDVEALTCTDCQTLAPQAVALLALGAYCPRCGAGAAGAPEHCVCPPSPHPEPTTEEENHA